MGQSCEWCGDPSCDRTCDEDEPEDDAEEYSDPEFCCVECGERDCGEACQQCGEPLCYVHHELGAGFCPEHPSKEYQPEGG